MTTISQSTLRSLIGAAALAAAALSLAAPASAAVDDAKYPKAVAADAADMMAKFGGVVIDVETKFPGRALDFYGCGVIKHDIEKTLSNDERDRNFTRCAPNFQQTLGYDPNAVEPGFYYPPEPPVEGPVEGPFTVELPDVPVEGGGLSPIEPGGQ